MGWREMQLSTLRALVNGECVFLTGKAGTGKSTVANAYIKRVIEENRSIVKVGPTGVSAINIHGITMHRAFGLPIEYLPESKMLHTSNEIREAIAACDVLLIDEISMVRSDNLSHVEHVMRSYSKINGSPWGGKQIIVVGDFYQLSPVCVGYDEKNVRRDYGGVFPFECKAWRQGGFKIFELDEVVRQGDPTFVNWLNSIRESDANINQTLQEINDLIADKPKPESCTTICFTNRVADNINKIELGKIPGKPIVFSSIVDGIVSDSDKSVLDELEIKVGAKIMTVVNEGEYVNGTVGTVTAFCSDTITMDGSIVIKRKKWEVKGLKLDKKTGKATEGVIGTFTQFPVKLAWAITVHKSQGQTISTPLHLQMDGTYRGHGQFYVAISRCTDINNLTLGRPIYNSDVVVDDKVRSFMLMHLLGTVSMDVPKLLLPLFNNLITIAQNNPTGAQIEAMIERTNTWMGLSEQ